MIPLNEPLLDGNERAYLNECIDTGWISSEGPFVRRFEAGFAEQLGQRHGVAVCNGTAALEAALYGLGVGPGDEVIMPSFTIISCAVACLRLGATPVLVDIDPETWTMDVTQVSQKVTERTRTLMAVHMYGHPVDMDPLMAIARERGIRVLEDAAEVHGARYYSEANGAWQQCGAIGDVSSWSFYANKILTTGEGGMVVTDCDEIAQRARGYRNLCFGTDERFRHEDIGCNFRMTNLQAAVGLAQLEQMERFVDIKRRRGEYYRERFAGVPQVRFQPEKPYARSVYWMYSIEIDPGSGFDADMVRRGLAARKIGSRPFFRGLHAQPALQDRGLFHGESYPRTDFAYRQGLYLPSGLTLTEQQIDTVVDAVKEILSA